MNNSIDFSPLATYSKLFLFFRLIRRVKMIIVRVIWVLVLLAVIAGMIWAFIWANQQIDKGPPTDGTDGSYTYSGSYDFGGDGRSYDIGWVFPLLMAVLFGPKILSLIVMNNAWNRFAQANGFAVLLATDSSAQEVIKVPSFRGKLLSVSLSPIKGKYNDTTFTLHTRQYKEGGVLRWRERQMDTVITLLLPANLPHIVVNARGNEKARRSNITKSFPAENKFQFEGAMGAKYDVYAKPESRILALQLFTPDVLQVLYDRLPTADIELLGDKLWIVQRYGILDDTLAKTMVESADALYKELEKQMRTAGVLTPIDEQLTVGGV